jgi:4-amino-4-deoxy-L-arabinose transferase-like glycosyltransferase
MLYPLRMADAPGATHADAPNPVTRDETSATSTRGIQSRSGSWRGLGSLPGWTLTGLLASVVGLLAALTRFPRLSTAPPGFLIDEAAAALFAQSINRQHLPVFFGGGTPDVQEPFFLYVMKWTGTLFGWDVYGARAAAALCGVAVAVACALWFRRALGVGWGLAGGVLVASSFWQLMFSRQAIRPISMPLCAAAGLWCLWEALECPPDARTLGLPRRLLWHAATGVLFGLGLYTYIAFRLVGPAALAIGALLLWNRRAGDRRVDPRGLALALLLMLLVAVPLGRYYATHSADFWRRTQQVRDQEGGASVLRDPLAATRGYLVTLRSFVWDGYAAPNVNQPGRPILDPLLALWAMAGFALALRHPLRPLHGVALLWFLVFILPSALSSPGHPVRELGATPAVFLFPLLAMRGLVQYAHSRDMSRSRRTLAAAAAAAAADTHADAGSPPQISAPTLHGHIDAGGAADARRWSRGYILTRVGFGGAALTLVALSVAGSALWSLHDYFQVWAPSNAAYVAMQGDVRDSLATIDQLPDDGAPVYYSTWTLERLVTFLSPRRVTRAFDGRTMGALPASGGGYLIYPTVTAPDPALLTYLTAGAPAPYATGHAPNGAVAWQAWRLGEPQRTRLPYTIPTLAVANGVELLGFAIAPAPPLDANGAPLPDARRMVAVTLIWRVAAGTAPQTARVRLVPVASDTTDPTQLGAPTSADAALIPSPPALLGRATHEIIITRLLLPFPTGADTADAQLALAANASGATPSFGDFVDLNRIAYRLETAP